MIFECARAKTARKSCHLLVRGCWVTPQISTWRTSPRMEVPLGTARQKEVTDIRKTFGRIIMSDHVASCQKFNQSNKAYFDDVELSLISDFVGKEWSSSVSNISHNSHNFFGRWQRAKFSYQCIKQRLGRKVLSTTNCKRKVNIMALPVMEF